ncbi:radical SAM protein [Rhodopirellula sallentina]|uniref:Radical SAM domain-containing protein n=1 Tax=Rhodopirellula sallentina SM41 TaxID=1263870 RepID=M5U680_9BACT|nr:radical SAM domain-containing protein [Rhodopirellula sallentina]EMI53366.1 radical SAM domain-containing protein [Rhodopirellula sallentina SM41]
MIQNFSETTKLTTAEILRLRGSKNVVSSSRPYTFMVEQERSANGEIEDVATVFLANSECPYRCLMCDLWKNTLDHPVHSGAIAEQIRYALKRLPSAKSIKLYNSGNFFDARAIPRTDYREIAELCSPFDRVVVENHPALCNQSCVALNELLDGRLEIAMGLETVHPEVLPLLNKQMTLERFAEACDFLVSNSIAIRAFVLLRPPYLDEEEGIEWAVKSIEFAADCGVGCIAVIPTRAGNGAIEFLAEQGAFTPPRLSSLESVLDNVLKEPKAYRVFGDLWDAGRFSSCDRCVDVRVQRIQNMNLTQTFQAPVVCDCTEPVSG